jgi:DNA-binding PadR family transcriptional regulator
MQAMPTLTFDPDLAEAHRLSLVLILAAEPQGRESFAALGHRLGLSEGNLACHLRRLERAGLIAAHRNGCRGRASRTEFALTDAGRTRLAQVRGELEAAVEAIADSLELAGGLDSRAGLPGSSVSSAASALAWEVERAPAQPASGGFVEERFSGPD